MMWSICAVLLGLLVIGLVALNIWDRRHPMTSEEKQQLNDEMRIW